MSTILVTGAGTGLGKFLAFSLARRGHEVYAGVENNAQVSALRHEVAEAGLSVEVLRLDITNEMDRTYASRLEVDILVNNAGIGEGGSLADMPAAVLQRQLNINFFATIELTKLFLKKFVRKNAGRVVFVSSIAGVITPPFGGAYCASKHALEAAAQALHQEFADKPISFATINPGPYQTGFNDRIMEGAKYWYDPETAIFPQGELTFPMEQFDQEQDIEGMADVVDNPKSPFRNLFPKDMEDAIKQQEAAVWTW
ncbi:SDR family oxidoreductase [Saccharibacter floricola]|uniref:Short-chain dehydrogenase n=1 Tax=Saccharibacter floricola DSM 15669 TaxID=1123227 RepID=A0ABQ0NZ52_9PROT|nr:SDR family oxidoreductase [Saccharibacter floricola]GBQ07118.1 short-chain dehydrogenase [Saccharibacter floricola DSM 15669]